MGLFLQKRLFKEFFVVFVVDYIILSFRLFRSAVDLFIPLCRYLILWACLIFVIDYG